MATISGTVGPSRRAESVAPLAAFGLAAALAFGGVFLLLPAVRLALPATPLPDPLVDQHQDAETLSFVLAFAFVLPLAAWAGPRLAAALGAAASAVAALLIATAAGIVVLSRAADALGIAGALPALLVLAACWWVAALAGLRALHGHARHRQRLVGRALPLWLAAAALVAVAALAFVDLGALAPLPLAAGIAAAAAVALIHARVGAPSPSTTWMRVVDVTAVALLALAVPNLVIYSPGEPGAALETDVLQFHQTFFLGPANQVLAGDAVLVDTLSQYGVGSIYLIAGWFNLVPAGYGTLGLLEGLLAAAVFVAAYVSLRLARVAAPLAIGAMVVALTALVYGLSYPIGGLLQHGAIRFGLPMALLVLAVAEARGSHRAGLRAAQLAVLGLASIWALEAFAYTLLTLGAIVAAQAALAPAGERLRLLRGWLVGALVACVAAHVLLAALTLVGAGSPPDWGRYLTTLAAFLFGRVGDVTYDFAAWSPAFLVAGLYLLSVLALVTMLALRRPIATERRPLTIAIAGSTGYGIALFSYFVNRSAEHILPYVCLPAILIPTLWLSLLLGSNISARVRSATLAAAIVVGAILVADAWPGAGGRISESALAHLPPGDPPLRHAVKRLWDGPVIKPQAPEGVRLLGRHMPGEERSLVITEANLTVEILVRAGRASGLPLGDPLEDSLVAEQHLDAVRNAVGRLRGGERMLLDRHGAEKFAEYRADPTLTPVFDPFEGSELVSTELAALQELALKEIGRRFRLRTVAKGAHGLRVVELVPRTHG